MKKYLFVISLFLTEMSFSQDHAVFYQTTNGEYAFKLENGTCILYNLSRYDSRIYWEWDIHPTYRTQSQLDSLGILFSNGQYAISYDYKYFRVHQLKNGKIRNRKTFVAKKLEDPSKVYEAINHTYWDVLYQNTIDETRMNYLHFREYRHLSHRIGDEVLW